MIKGSPILVLVFLVSCNSGQGSGAFAKAAPLPAPKLIGCFCKSSPPDTKGANDMPIRRMPIRPPSYPDAGRGHDPYSQVDNSGDSNDPHEIEGSVFGAGPEEYDAGEAPLPPIQLEEADQPEGLVSQVLALSKPERGMIGRTITIAPGKTETILDWQVEDDESALPVTLVLGIPNRADKLDPTTTLYVQVKALIKYGIGGSQNEILMDVVPGNMITIPATYMRVDIISDELSAQNVEVSAFLCRFAAAHPAAKFTKIGIVPIPTISQVVLPVPSLAKSVRVYADAASPWNLFLLTSSSAVAGRFQFAGGPASGGNDSKDVVIPGDVFYISISNPSLVNAIGNWRMIFDLY